MSESSESDRENDQAQPVIDVDADPLRKEFETERNIETVQEVFPDVERDWIERQLRNGHSAGVILDYIVREPKEVPRIQKKAKAEDIVAKASTSRKRCSSEKHDEPSAIYMLNGSIVDLRYSRAAREILHNDFSKVSKRSLDQVLSFFNDHYAPAFYALTETLKHVDNRLRNIQLVLNENLAIFKKPNRAPPLVQINQSKRRNNPDYIHLAPPELQAEIEWCRENLSNYKFPCSNAITPRRAARKRTEAEYECMICCDMHMITEMVSCADGHLFCRECLQNYAKEIAYGQAKVLLTCLDNECKCSFSRGCQANFDSIRSKFDPKFDLETLETALDDACIKKLDERLQFEDVLSAGIPNLIRCKFCNYAAIVDVPIEVNKVFSCENPQCQKEFCRICEVDWEEHIGLPCKEVETSVETKLRKEMEEKMVLAITRECHRCKSKIIKETGCNKMTCRCGAKMCYVCRMPDIEYDHFCRHFRDPPGNHCAQCRACSLWEDTTKTVDAENFEKVKREAVQAQEALGRNVEKVIGVDETKLNPPDVRPKQPVGVVQQPQLGRAVQLPNEVQHAQQRPPALMDLVVGPLPFQPRQRPQAYRPPQHVQYYRPPAALNQQRQQYGPIVHPHQQRVAPAGPFFHAQVPPPMPFVGRWRAPFILQENIFDVNGGEPDRF